MRHKASVLLPAFVASLALFAAAASAGPVIIKCGQSCDAVAAAITGHGGRITYRYRYVDAIAAELPNMAVAAVKGLVEPGAIRKDVVVALPAIAHDRDGAPMIASVAAVSADALSPSQIVAMASAHPNAYLINNTNMDLDGLLGAGYTGAGVTVAQIDSGVRPGFPNISLDGSVIGGEDLVGDGFGYSNTSNDGHGTFVAGMISANVIFTFSPSFVTAVSNYCPSCVINGNQIPMIGSAPSSSLYELRVFPPGQGAPSSRIMAAMERVLTLRENYDAGMPPTQNPDGSYDSLDIRVCNMSLGGPTMYAGRDLEDQLTQQFLDHDIVLVVSAANAGPSGSTTGSPGTGMGSLTVAASSDAVHERILRDLQYGNGVGALYRPFDGVQTAYFSSRGPTADGRVDPEITANGFASFGQGFGTPNSIDIGSGTSFSAPSVAGVAAVLRDAYPGATAKQIRDALIDSANPHILGDGSTPLDQGQGYVDAGAAATRLTSWMSGWHHDRDVRPSEQVWLNIWKGARVPTYMGWVSRKAKNLLPGQRMETYYYIPPFTSQVTITLSDVIPGADQNVLLRRRHPVHRPQREDERHRRGRLPGERLLDGRHVGDRRPRAGPDARDGERRLDQRQPHRREGADQAGVRD